MQYQFTSAFYLQSLPCLFALILVFILWKRRNVDGVIYLILFECSTALWALSDGFEHAAMILETKILWSQLSLLGASTIPPLFLLFTLAYFRNESFPGKGMIFLLFLIPAINFGLAITNQYHHLVWQKIELINGNESIYHYGSWFWIYLIYELSIPVLAISILLKSIILFYKIYKTQIIYLILATVLPFISCVIYIFKLTSFNYDLTPLSLIFAGIFIATGIYKQRMLEIIPIARKQIIENIGDGILVIDIAGRIVDINPFITKLLKSDPKKLLGKSFDTIKNRILPSFNNYSEDKWVTETTILTENGKSQFEVTCNPVKLANNVLVGKIMFFHDITQRKEALDLAIASNQLLLKEIGEKEKLITDLDAYARSVAHDLKNPLSGLIGIRDITREFLNNKQNEEALELLDMAYEQCTKMYKIVDDLLLLSRIRKEDVKPVPLNMPAIIAESLKRFNGQISKNNLKIEMPKQWPKVLGHPMWIEEVWFNLISNALKFGGNPPVVKIGYNKINGSGYRFWIQDNGNGLPEHCLPKLFHDFERLEHKNKEGHGLGLSMIKRIIEKLDGEVQVTSKNSPGEGCVFSFTLKSQDNKDLYRASLFRD